MMWNTGNWSSYPADGRAFIERDDRGWWVYHTNDEGRIQVTSENPLVFAPPACSTPFDTVEEAQRWAEQNIPARESLPT